MAGEMRHVRHEFSVIDYYDAREDYAQNWKTLDQVLYRLCRDHPLHCDLPSVTAKVVIIGRSYATGIERKVSTEGTQGSSICQVARLLFTHSEEMDRWLARLRKISTPLDTWNIPEILTIHGLILKLLAELTIGNQAVRTFVSKYLHFHNPDVPMYDSIASGFLPKLVPLGIQIPAVKQADQDYADYVCRFAKLYQYATVRGVPVTVRLLDSYLIWKKENSRPAPKAAGKQASVPLEHLRWDVADLGEKFMADSDVSFQEFGKALKMLTVADANLNLRLDAFRRVLLEKSPFRSPDEVRNFLGIRAAPYLGQTPDEDEQAYLEASEALLTMSLDELAENLKLREGYSWEWVKSETGQTRELVPPVRRG